MIHSILRRIRELHFLQTNTTAKFFLVLGLFMPWVTGIWPDREESVAWFPHPVPRTAFLISGVLFLDLAPWCELGAKRFTFQFWLCQCFLCDLGQSSLHSIYPVYLPLSRRCSENHTNQAGIVWSCLMFSCIYVLLMWFLITRDSFPIPSSTYGNPSILPSSLNKALNFPCSHHGP